MKTLIKNSEIFLLTQKFAQSRGCFWQVSIIQTVLGLRKVCFVSAVASVLLLTAQQFLCAIMWFHSTGRDYFWLGVIVFFLQLLSKFVTMILCSLWWQTQGRASQKAKLQKIVKQKMLKRENVIEKRSRNELVEINVMRNRSRTFI